MTPEPLSLESLSNITARYSRTTFEDRERILVIAFAGDYREGSAGNPDAARMRAHVAAAVAAWGCDGVVLDLTELGYRWGDGLIGVFEATDGDARLPRPGAVVAGPRSRGGLSSLCDPAALSDDLDAAVAKVHAEAAARAAELERDELRLCLGVLIRDDVPPDDALPLIARAPTLYQEWQPSDWRTTTWRTESGRVEVRRASPDDLTWALTCAPTHGVRDAAGALLAVVLGARVELPARVLALPR